MYPHRTRGDITWKRALQPDLEEVSSWRFCRAQIVSRRITYPPNFLIGAEIFTRRGDFNVRLSSTVYYVAHRFYNSAYIFMRHQYFGHPPIFSWSANILGFRLYFHETPIFCVFASILGRRQYFLILLDFLLQIFVYIFSIYLCILYAPIFSAQLFWNLGLRLM